MAPQRGSCPKKSLSRFEHHGAIGPGGFLQDSHLWPHGTPYHRIGVSKNRHGRASRDGRQMGNTTVVSDEKARPGEAGGQQGQGSFRMLWRGEGPLRFGRTTAPAHVVSLRFKLARHPLEVFHGPVFRRAAASGGDYHLEAFVRRAKVSVCRQADRNPQRVGVPMGRMLVPAFGRDAGEVLYLWDARVDKIAGQCAIGILHADPCTVETAGKFTKGLVRRGERRVEPDALQVVHPIGQSGGLGQGGSLRYSRHFNVRSWLPLGEGGQGAEKITHAATMDQ